MAGTLASPISITMGHFKESDWFAFPTIISWARALDRAGAKSVWRSVCVHENVEILSPRCSRSRETSGDARNDQILTNSATKILNGVALHRLPRRRRQTNRVEQGPCRRLRLGVKRLNQQTPSWMGSRTSPQRGTQTRSNQLALTCAN